MEEVCQLNVLELDRMNGEFINILTYQTQFPLVLPKMFVNEVFLVDTNRIIRVPDLDLGELFQFIRIWLLIVANPGTNREEYLIKRNL